MNGNSFDVPTRNTKMRMKIIAALTPSPKETAFWFSASISNLYSGLLVDLQARE